MTPCMVIPTTPIPAIGKPRCHATNQEADVRPCQPGRVEASSDGAITFGCASTRRASAGPPQARNHRPAPAPSSGFVSGHSCVFFSSVSLPSRAVCMSPRGGKGGSRPHVLRASYEVHARPNASAHLGCPTSHAYQIQHSWTAITRALLRSASATPPARPRLHASRRSSHAVICLMVCTKYEASLLRSTPLIDCDCEGGSPSALPVASFPPTASCAAQLMTPSSSPLQPTPCCASSPIARVLTESSARSQHQPSSDPTDGIRRNTMRT